MNGSLHPGWALFICSMRESGKLLVKKNELRNIGVVGLQLHWIRLITSRVATAVP